MKNGNSYKIKFSKKAEKDKTKLKSSNLDKYFRFNDGRSFLLSTIL